MIFCFRYLKATKHTKKRFELEGKKKKPEEEEKEQNKKLKESILKELTISKDNLENYIEELLDKIIVVEKAKTINEAQIKENNTQKSEKQKQKAQLDKKETKQNECEIELKIILAGNKIITYGSASKLRQISQLGRLRGTDYKKVPLCHSHAHRKGLLSGNFPHDRKVYLN